MRTSVSDAPAPRIPAVDLRPWPSGGPETALRGRGGRPRLARTGRRGQRLRGGHRDPDGPEGVADLRHPRALRGPGRQRGVVRAQRVARGGTGTEGAVRGVPGADGP